MSKEYYKEGFDNGRKFDRHQLHTKIKGAITKRLWWLDHMESPLCGSDTEKKKYLYAIETLSDLSHELDKIMEED